MGRLKLVLVVLAVVSACSEPSSPQLGVTAGPPAVTPTADAELAALRRRPWALPALAPGEPCPVTLAKHRPDPEISHVWGNGLVGPAGLDTGVGGGPDLTYRSPDSSLTDRAWGVQKVMWAADPTLEGPVLVRGRQLDGPNEVRFEDPAMDELIWRPDDPEARAGGWRDYPSYTRLRAPGCYGYQIESADGTQTVVFRAHGPVVR